MSLENQNNSLSDRELHINYSVLSALKLKFQDQFDDDIIESVAYECKYNFELSETHLIDMSGLQFMYAEETVGTNLEVQPENTPYSPYPLNMQSLQNTTTPVVKKQKILSTLDQAIADVESGKLVLILLRGLPGSGKSTLAKKIVNATVGPCNPRQFILSADDFFDTNGEYQYNVHRIGEAHDWNQKRAFTAITKLQSPIIIDNTNTECWEMKPYCVRAVTQGYLVYILETHTTWSFSIRDLVRKNIHGIPADTIRDMYDRYEHNITPERLFQRYGIQYGHLQPPRMRKFPEIKEIPSSSSTNNCLTVETIAKRDVATSTRDRNGPSKLLATKPLFVNQGLLPPNYPREGHYDKGTSTLDSHDEVSATCEIQATKIEFLQSVFENVPREYLKDVLDKCQGNIEWSIEILVEDHQVLLPNYESPKKSVTVPEIASLTIEVGDQAAGFSGVMDNETCKFLEQENLTLKKHMENQSLALKKHLESNVVINKEHYSEQLLKLKGCNKEEMSDAAPGPSKPSPDGNESFILIESDIDFDDDDCEDFVEISDDSDQATEDMIELNMGCQFVEQLNKLFGDPGMQLPPSFKPVVEIPRALGKQLHALYLESMFKQIEYQKITMIEEDEEFALNLQLEEINKVETIAPDFKQIMKDQAEAQRCQKLADKEWKNLTPEDMAYKLTMQKFSASFPRVSVETLSEVYRAHGKNYDWTESALISAGETPVQNTKKTLSASTLKDMKETYDDAQQLQDIPDSPSHVLRQQAEDYQKKRIELQNKAKQYYSKGMPEVAYFYSDLASKQTQMWEKCNNLAVMQIVNEGFNRVNNADTIDLHYLRVPEALNALDIFIDEVVHRLQNQNKSHHFILVITGRGNNSPGGIARIRPSVQNRLKRRKLRYQLVNAGLLKVKIFKNSQMTAHLA